jgi:TfoX/Sxy family transcriptional regulator of competence genes
MAKWKKSPPELVAAFDAALPRAARVERRQMFGYPCAFVNGNMAVGLHENRLIARVPSEAARHPCVILGRTMKNYAAISDASGLTTRALRRWIARAIEFTATLPPKAKKPAAAGRKHAAKRGRGP